MALASGTRIGPYEVTAQIGVGGMGEVYRATDTNLKRQVAIKVLPASVAGDAERLARFQREAEVLAALNHPNIAAIYGLEDADRTKALVMELVEGPTLADRIARGPLSLADARPVAVQIADALSAAHERGIVHRDLKPANIKVRPDGMVKVLDFGLAKAMDTGTPVAEGAHTMLPTMMPTVLSPALVTGAGFILGTAAYMSPEQARGEAVDKRADVWALGAVLYEMLTGRRAFAGDSVSDVLASVLAREPDWAALPATLPPVLRTVIQRCLQKDVRQRVHDVGDVRLALEGAFDVATVATPAAKPATARLPWALASLAIVAATVLGVGLLRRPVPDVSVVRSLIPPPEGAVFDFDRTVGPAVISPDGKLVAFSASSGSSATGDVRTRLWVRPLDSLEARPLEGTDGASFPFWSPDSQQLGFVADGLQRVAVTGGAPVRLLRGDFIRGATWGADGTIVYDDGELYALSPGGSPREITGLVEGLARRSPWLLPDSRHVLYFASGRGEIRVASLDGGGDALVTQATSNAIYAHGMLLFMREATLLAQPFDPSTRTLSGTPAPVASDVAIVTGAEARGVFSASQTGTLLYQTGGTQPAITLAWFDKEGRRQAVVGELGNAAGVSLSRDARYSTVAITGSDLRTDLWRVDAMSGQRTRLTFEEEPGTLNGFVAWSPDGRSIAHAARRGDKLALLRRLVTGTGGEERVLELDQARGFVYRVTAWTKDGTLVFSDAGGGGGISTVAMTGGPKTATLLVANPDNAQNGRLSPNGRWLSYQVSLLPNTPSGIFVEAFPRGGNRHQVAEFSTLAVWGPDGRSLYYASNSVLMVVSVTESEGSLVFGPPRAVMPITQGRGFSYDIAPDGRILALVTSDDRAARPLTLVQNWRAELQK